MRVLIARGWANRRLKRARTYGEGLEPRLGKVWSGTPPALILDTLAQSHASLAVKEAGTVAADAEHRKRQKYAHMEGSHIFTPAAVETLGVFGSDARALFRDIAHRITATTQDSLAHQYLNQRVAVAVQRGNAAAILGTMAGGTFNDL